MAVAVAIEHFEIARFVHFTPIAKVAFAAEPLASYWPITLRITIKAFAKPAASAAGKPPSAVDIAATAGFIIDWCSLAELAIALLGIAFAESEVATVVKAAAIEVAKLELAIVKLNFAKLRIAYSDSFLVKLIAKFDILTPFNFIEFIGFALLTAFGDFKDIIHITHAFVVGSLGTKMAIETCIGWVTYSKLGCSSHFVGSKSSSFEVAFYLSFSSACGLV